MIFKILCNVCSIIILALMLKYMLHHPDSKAIGIAILLVLIMNVAVRFANYLDRIE